MPSLLFDLQLPHFAAELCAQRDPALGGKDFLVVAGEDGHERVLDISPKLRGRGLSRGMALQRLPREVRASLVRIDDHLLRRASEKIVVFLERYSPVVASGDAGHYIFDMSGTGSLWGQPLSVAQRLLADLITHHGHRGKVGIGETRLAADLAAKVAPLGGAFEIWAGGTRAFMWAMPLAWLPGLGPATRLSMTRDYGHRVLGDLVPYGEENLRLLWGADGNWAHRAATGRLVEALVPYRFERQVEVEIPLGVHDPQVCQRALNKGIVQAARNLRQEEAFAHGFTLSVTYGDGHLFVKKERLKTPSYHERLLRRDVGPVFDKALARRVFPTKALLLFQDLRPPLRQLSLMADTGREDRLVKAFDTLRSRFGPTAVQMGFETTPTTPGHRTKAPAHEGR